jgi:hypothetical protein
MTLGALVDGTVSFFINPGSRNVAGETLVPALTPPQPAPTNGSDNTTIASQINFQFNLTSLV